jgi:cytochrome c-type protein NapC
MLASLISAPAFAIDWASVPGKEVVLFYPGQSSWEYLLTGADHSGASKFRDGKNCHDCHLDEEKMMGGTLVSGNKNEPTPIAGKPPFVPATVKVANDGQNLYVHLEFKEGTQPDSKMDPDFATKVTMMLGDAKVAEATRAGCWGTCHDDAARMPNGGTGDRTKYLSRTRAKNGRTGGGDELKPADELAKMLADGQNMEYWQARLNPGAPAVAISGTIFDKRVEVKPSVVTAEASFANGGWSVTMGRKLNAGAPFKDLAPGKTYNIGFAIHAGRTAKRFHYVSFEHTVVLDQGAADFVAAKK